MNKNWIIALVLILAVVVVFAACKGNENEETPQSTTQTESTIDTSTESTTEVESDDELNLIPADDLIIPDGDFSDEGALIIGGNSSDNELSFSSNNSGEDHISWDEL